MKQKLILFHLTFIYLYKYYYKKNIFHFNKLIMNQF